MGLFNTIRRFFASDVAPTSVEETKETPAQPLLKYSDIFDVVRYEPPEDAPEFSLPAVYGFRIKPPYQSPDPRPSFVFLETSDEIESWHLSMAGEVVLNDDQHVTDEPLLRWNGIPSLLTSDDTIVATYLPAKADENWPPLVVQTHPFDAELSVKPARDRYYFEQNKFFGVL